MKKVNISMYVSDDFNASNFIKQHIINASVSLDKLVNTKETSAEKDGSASNYVLFYPGLYSSMNAKVFELARVTDENKEDVKTIYRNSYYLDKLNSDVEFFVLNKERSQDNSASVENMNSRCIVLDLNNEEHLNFISNTATPNNLRDRMSKLEIVKNGNSYIGFSGSSVDSNLILLLAKRYPVDVIRAFMKGQIYSNKQYEENRELFTDTYNKIKEIIISETKNGSDASLGSILATLAANSSNIYASKKGLDVGSNNIKMTEREFLDLVDIIIDKTSKQNAIQKITAAVYREQISTKGPQCGYDYDLAKYVFKKYNLITDEEIDLLNKKPTNFLQKFKKEIATIAIEAFYYSSNVITTKSCTWSLNLVDEVIRNLRTLIQSWHEGDFDEEYSKLSESEKDEFFDALRVILRRYIIVKELPMYSAYLAIFTARSRNEDFKVRFIKLIADVLESYKGTESMTIRSIVASGGMCLNGYNLFNYVNIEDHPRLQRIIFEYKLKN